MIIFHQNVANCQAQDKVIPPELPAGGLPITHE